jgi:hypothetical protein
MILKLFYCDRFLHLKHFIFYISLCSVLVVCHLAVLRCIFAYFMGTKLEDVPFQAFQRHTIYELKPGMLSYIYCTVLLPVILSYLILSYLILPLL